MKVKELLKTVNVAWSPPAQHPIMLAAGTAAQQLDASFSTSASLDLYSLNLQQPGYEMELRASVPSDHRFHKIIWGSYGNNPAGIIVGGCEDGTIKIYSAAKLLARESNCLISSPHRHAGPVRAMDFNPFREENQLATGATESEIYIWDINTNTPTTLSRSQQSEDVQHIAWNKQVHLKDILASTFSQCCIIWNVKEKKPIFKLSDTNSRVRWKVAQWHPDIGTQLCLASEDDQTPIIELWDVRVPTSPLKTLQGHQRGVLSIAWNPHDSDLLLSCAKDNRILCWNPNSNAPNGEVICELAQTAQWNFDVSWCPRYPGLIVGSSFDGHAVVYSLLGGQQQETSNKIIDSFPGMDPFTQSTVQTGTTAVLTKAPKWLKRPFGASFGFGGKLVIFENQPADSANKKGDSNRKVIISQVITQPNLIQRSNKLKATLETEQYSDFCKEKMEKSPDDHTKKIWCCVRAYFDDNVTKSILELLGYNIDIMNNKLNQFIPQDDMTNIIEGVSNLNNVLNGNAMVGNTAFDAMEEQGKKLVPSNKSADSTYTINTSDDEDGLITQAILLGNIEAAVSLCFTSKRYADAIILSMAAGPELLARTQYRYFSEHSSALNSLINSLLSENWAEVVKNSDIKCWKEALVGIFTNSNTQERSALCDMLGDRLASCENPVLKKQAQICYICSGNLNKLIEVANADIQEVVELVVIMQKALELQGIKEIHIKDRIASVLSQYAEMLAAEGDLEAALNYLGNSQEQRVSMLRDRLCKALSYVQEQRSIAKPANQNYHYEQTIPGRPSQNLQNATYNPLQQSLQQATPAQNLQNTYNPLQQPLQQATPAQNLQNTYNPLQQPLQQTTPVQSWNTTPLKQAYGVPTNQTLNPQFYGMPTSQPQTQSTVYDQYSAPHSYNQIPATQPPPPPPPSGSSLSTGSRPSSVGPQSRSKYLIDPSVKSTPTYGQSSFPSPNQLYNSQQIAPVPGYPLQNAYQPQVSMSSNIYASQPPSFVNNPKEPEPYKPLQPNIMQPPLQQNTPQTQMYDPIRAQPPPQMQTHGNGNVPYQLPPQASGWNDPPNAKSSKAQPKTEYQLQNPILHPLRSSQPEPSPLQQDNFYQEHHSSYNVQYGQGMSNTAPVNKPVEPLLQPTMPAVPAKMVEPEKSKAPIPEQHVHLKTILDELKNQCYENAKNPQIKRKIEDVSKKLEVLYDCLRENKLSQNTLQGLHQISQMIQNGNYTGGLDLHTQLVSGPDFSQIASFMPGIKVLLLSALQLSVYIR
ncbi:protein transport protein Sec31A isoform X1 [Cataglyphis hispanica]|uniref:protein transport protein Sec31A isoform X1 n=1 Tax=Cataglyphis hispanica TaxID=1086592 RepID=UPI0021800C8C|nr:protein transport protein Sec31A isoform X1 [Cataglyphis hispanica]